MGIVLLGQHLFLTFNEFVMNRNAERRVLKTEKYEKLLPLPATQTELTVI